MYKIELHEGESPAQRTENVEECVNETQWVKSHQLQRHLNKSWINTTAPRLHLIIRPTTQRP
jgi:hypothetical protein